MSAITDPIHAGSSFTPPQIPNSNADLSTNDGEVVDNGELGIPYCTSVEIPWVRKGSDVEIHSTLSLKQSNFGLVHDAKSSITILGKGTNYKLRFEKTFNLISDVFLHKENSVHHLSKYRFNAKNDELYFSFAEIPLSGKVSNSQSNIAFFIEGKSAQGNPVLIRADSELFLLSKLKGKGVERKIKNILTYQEGPSKPSVAWPEISPLDALEKATVSTPNSVSLQQLRTQISFNSAIASMQKAISTFEANGQFQAARTSSAIERALTDAPLDNEMLPVMNLMIEVGLKFLQTLADPPVKNNSISPTENEQGSKTGKEEDSSEEMGKNNGKNSEEKRSSKRQRLNNSENETPNRVETTVNVEKFNPTNPDSDSELVPFQDTFDPNQILSDFPE